MAPMSAGFAWLASIVERRRAMAGDFSSWVTPLRRLTEKPRLAVSRCKMPEIYSDIRATVPAVRASPARASLRNRDRGVVGSAHKEVSPCARIETQAGSPNTDSQWSKSVLAQGRALPMAPFVVIVSTWKTTKLWQKPRTSRRYKDGTLIAPPAMTQFRCSSVSRTDKPRAISRRAKAPTAVWPAATSRQAAIRDKRQIPE